MGYLTDDDREELHHAVLRDVLASGETVPEVHATAERIVARHRVEAWDEGWTARDDNYWSGDDNPYREGDER